MSVASLHTAMRTALSVLGYKSCTIKAASTPADNTGASTWATSATVSCFYEAQTNPGGQSFAWDPETGYGYTFWFDISASVPTIKADDRITVDGLTFQVADAPPISEGGMLRVEARKIADTVL